MNARTAPAEGPFDVLAIVTSAGGLDAISAVLVDLPADFPVAVIVGQHLGAESALVDILRRRIGLPVCWAAEGTLLEAGTVYVCPPHTRMEVLPDRSCSLTVYRRELMVEKPLDALLKSLADSFGPRAIAVVLTGMGRDGALGARALKSAGGAVLVQNEASAAFPDMPRAAIDAGVADLVLPLPEIGRALAGVVAGGRFPQPRNEAEAREALFAGAGDAAAALRRVDWTQTPLGPVLRWPGALKAVVAAILHSRFATCIFWGPQLVQVYNDAWISVLGSDHPAAAGVPARLTAPESWPRRADVYQRVLQTGEASFAEDQPVETNRHGFLEEAFFTLSLSPLYDQRGTVCGVMSVATETTERVLAERRLVALRRLAAAGAEQANAACAQALRVLEDVQRDVPFAALYLLDASGLRATLAGATGVPAGSAFAPHALDPQVADAAWPVGKVVRQGEPVLLDDLGTRLHGFHAGSWPEPPDSALLLPLRLQDDEVGAVLVAGISRRLALDGPYRDFLLAVAQQVGANLLEARRRERERERLEQLAELDRAKTEFFSNVSHEFRTPLTLILGPLEDLLGTGDVVPHPLRQELEVASRNASRLLNLVDTLLDFSQIEAGRLRARLQAVDLSALTVDIVALFRSAIARAGLLLECDCPPLGQPVMVDPGMWEKIVSNLLSNALKFTFEGSIAVRLRLLGQHVELTVSDTGVGIPEEELPHVFRRFHRVRGTGARTEEGTGIGLAMVHDLVQVLRGRVRARSVPGAGTDFTVWLHRGLTAPAELSTGAAAVPQPRPVARQLAQEAERWSASTAVPPPPSDVVESMVGPAASGLASHVPGARLLVVDDNADMRDYLARTLGAHWQVDLAADGAGALAQARRAPPDLVLTDVMMPVLDGFGLLRDLRADEALKATPVVLVTARAHEEAAIEGLLAGADDYIAKPFSSRELVARVGAQLELARVRRQGERRVRELLALVPVGVYACDLAGNFEYFNRRAVELWGREPARDDHWWAFAGAPRVLLPDGSSLRPDASPMAEVLRTGEAVNDRELTIVRADGGRLELLLNIRPLLDEGRVVGAVCAFLDVTARKQAERALKMLNEELEQRTAALQASEQRLRRTHEIPTVGIIHFDLVGGIVEANDAFLATTGYTRAELEAGEVRYERLTPPEWRWRDERTLAELRQHGRVTPFEKEYFRKDGRRIWILCAAMLLDAQIAVEFIVDVTQRRSAEEKYRATVELNPQIIWTADAAGRVDFVSGKWTELTGRPAADALGAGWLEVSRPEDRERLLAAWREAVRTGGPYDVEVPLRQAAGGYRWSRVFALPARNAAGGVLQWFGSIEDIEDRKQAEAALHSTEARFGALVTATSYAVYRMSPDWSQMKGLEGQGFLADTGEPNHDWMEAYITPEDRPAVRQAIAEAIAGSKVFELEHRVRRADGSIGWTLSRAVPLLDAQGRITEWFGAATDITERKRSEAGQRLLAEVSSELVLAGAAAPDLRRLGERIARHFGARHCRFSEVAGPAGDGHAHDAHTLAVALARDGDSRLLLTLECGQQRAWQEDEVELARELARRIWAQVERARAEEARRASDERYRALLAAELRDARLLGELATRLAGERDPLRACEDALAIAMALTDADMGTVQVLDSASQELVIVACEGFPPAMQRQFHRVDAGSTTPCGVALATNTRAFGDYEAPGADADASLRAHRAVGLSASQSTPLVARSGHVMGMVSTHSRRPGRPAERTLHYLDLLARLVADLLESRHAALLARESERA